MSQGVRPKKSFRVGQRFKEYGGLWLTKQLSRGALSGRSFIFFLS